MKLKTLLSVTLISFLLFSCGDDDDNSTNTPPSGVLIFPDLTFEFEVTGAITRSESWFSPENSHTEGGHSNSALGAYDSDTEELGIITSADEYGFSLVAIMPSFSSGTYDMTEAIFIEVSVGSFDNLQSGTLTIDEVSVNYTAYGLTYYDADGSFTATIQDDATPANTIEFTGSFNGLTIASE